MYGEDPLPFHITTIDPEISEKYFPRELEDARWNRMQSVLPSTFEPRTPAREILVMEWSGVASTDPEWLPDWSDVQVARAPSVLPTPVRTPDLGRPVLVYTSKNKASSSYGLAS